MVVDDGGRRPIVINTYNGGTWLCFTGDYKPVNIHIYIYRNNIDIYII